MTMPLALEWEKVFKAIKASVKLMKQKPELNHNSNVASYGMAAMVPDAAFLNNMLKLHSAAILDAL